MIFFLLITVYLLLFTWFAWKNFRWAIGFFILTLPVYLIRFKIGNLPSTLLEAEFVGLFLFWLVKYFKTDYLIIIDFIKKQRGLFLFIGLFFIASIISIFISGIGDSNYWHMTVEALGIWRAFFLEPMLLFVILVGRCHSLVIPTDPAGGGGVEESLNGQRSERDSSTPLRSAQNDNLTDKDLIMFLILSTISISVVAILQKMSPWFYPPQLWDDVVGDRVTSFFTTPNAIGLYVAPILFLMAAQLLSFRPRLGGGEISVGGWFSSPLRGGIKCGVSSFTNTLTPALPLKGGGFGQRFLTAFGMAAALVAIGLSVSQGAWVAFGAGALVALYLLGKRRTAIILLLLTMSAGMYFSSIRTAVLFQDQAGQNRLKLWSYTEKYLSASPQNFILGTGIRKFFDKVQKPYYNNKELEPLLYPHNIFLNFWTETGLLGAVSFTGIVIYLFVMALKIKKSDKISGISLIAVLTVFVVQGLVDVPYFKNDLAFVFWILTLIVIASHQVAKQSQSNQYSDEIASSLRSSQ